MPSSDDATLPKDLLISAFGPVRCYEEPVLRERGERERATQEGGCEDAPRSHDKLPAMSIALGLAGP